MASIVRSTVKKILFALTIILCSVYLFTLFIPFLNPQHWWLIGFLGLTFPYLFFMLLFVFFFWLIVKPKLALLPLIIILMGTKQLLVTFAFHTTNTDLSKK